LDPQGEVAKDFRKNSALKTILSAKMSRSVQVYDLHNLVLIGDDLFKRIIVNSGFLSSLGNSSIPKLGRKESSIFSYRIRNLISYESQ
jgi:hypothetical protein